MSQFGNLKEIEGAFRPHVRKTDNCWIWDNAKPSSGEGYGYFYYNGTFFRAHRLAYVLATGHGIPRGFEICHSCDNRVCVRPSHLFLGTRSDNMRDASLKGKLKRSEAHKKRIGETHSGEQNYFHRLTEAQVREIRSLNLPRYAQGRYRDLARKYGVIPATISNVVKGRTWKQPS